jgi:hypothetical protein
MELNKLRTMLKKRFSFTVMANDADLYKAAETREEIDLTNHLIKSENTKTGRIEFMDGSAL